ncbi:hypothetical protein Hdeb2414_s0019g00550041 [Helianthus debilis subsp. tardiflorus]
MLWCLFVNLGAYLLLVDLWTKCSKMFCFVDCFTYSSDLFYPAGEVKNLRSTFMICFINLVK